MRIGNGYDVHKLVEGRKLILGGIEIPFELGLLGHSDADVLTHAVIDALIGAMGEGDIGRHFPDTNESYKGANSVALLAEINEMLRTKGFNIVNIDCVIVAQRPKLMTYTDQMRTKLARCLAIDATQINIKAKTEEGLGFTGAGLGISSYAVCLIEKILE